MWVRFKADYNWRQPGFTIAFKKGMTRNVTRACADAAMKAGKAEPRQTKEEAADEASPRWLTGDEALAAMGDWGDLETWKTRIDDEAIDGRLDRVINRTIGRKSQAQRSSGSIPDLSAPFATEPLRADT